MNEHSDLPPLPRPQPPVPAAPTPGRSRREFLGHVGRAVAWAAFARAETPPLRGAGVTDHRILIAPESPRPVQTAARELAAHSGAAIVTQPHPVAAAAADFVLVVGDDLRFYPAAAERLARPPTDGEWELNLPTKAGWILAGRTPRNVCRAALAWIAHPDRETNRVSRFDSEERFTMWDNSMNQMYRFGRGFDRRRHFREIARLGFSGVEINRYCDAGYHVLHRRFPADSYAWYMSYAPALDAFVESSLTHGLYQPDELARNLADLREAVELAREFGLKPGFVCYEPRGVNEAIFDRYPELRGSRVDHPGRSLEPRYALDIAHPRVLAHYAESLTRLMQVVPELRYFDFWTQDSGSGLPFTSKLYFGPNGSYLARTRTLGELSHDFIQALLDAGRKINPQFEVIMQIGHEYDGAERKAILAALPRGATFSHPVGGHLLDTRERPVQHWQVEEDRAAGVEPYAAVPGFQGHELEPIIGLAAPKALLKKFDQLRGLKLKRYFITGGVFSPPQSRYNPQQELFTELIRGETPDLADFLAGLARQWCRQDRDAARRLVEAWQAGGEALEAWPRLNWYHGGVGRTQGRWLVRPLVPDITRLSENERSAWQRCLFPLPQDLARLNLSFEGGIRFFEDAEFARLIEASDTKVIPLLTKAVGLLNQALTTTRGAADVLEDQRDRYRGLLLCMKTDRNVMQAQLATNAYLLKQGDPARHRQTVKDAIVAEIENTREWLRVLAESRTNFFRIAEKQETPFVLLTPREDLGLKLQVMSAHLDDEPGPFLPALLEPKRRKLAYGAVP